MSSEEAVIEAQSQRRLTSVSEEEELAATLDVYRLISKDTTRTVMTKTRLSPTFVLVRETLRHARECAFYKIYIIPRRSLSRGCRPATRTAPHVTMHVTMNHLRS